VCDGKPQPRKPPPPPVLGGAIQSAWSREILAALQRQLPPPRQDWTEVDAP
jgi:hypothetical protein